VLVFLFDDLLLFAGPDVGSSSSEIKYSSFTLKFLPLDDVDDDDDDDVAVTSY